MTEEEIADEEKRKISKAQAAKRIAAKSRFFLHVKSGLIAYHLKWSNKTDTSRRVR